MCELFAMSSREPTTVQLSLEEFSRHGGLTGPHKDGWGIAWYEDREIRLVKEAQPAATSACVRFVQGNPFVSAFALSHVRRATQGGVALRNCQPFVRELGGAWHGFAHNGDLSGIESLSRPGPMAFHPVGETDSELAFCALLERLRGLWRGAATPDLAARREVVEAFAATLRELGPANFLYCDGDALFVHADRRTQADGTIAAPGLWRLTRHCSTGGALACEGLRIEARGVEQDVVLVASVPLTAEGWEPLARGEVLVVRGGRAPG
ncbi:MAG: class II glutamine amidotransferase [Burkholderiales bacterium]|nr:class II glutamine amidotransferase [Burkholderiales bacterium]MDE2397386.1 class II glutamine amidotransferase [Burkholderiales bacterium]MDE2453652.1 class II glutamine amidotransferase [Burkholderiales bacterium]